MPAAGSGVRMGAGLPKQYRLLRGRAIIEHALAPFLKDPACRRIVVALAADDTHFATLAVNADSRVVTVIGGRERADSVAAGLAQVAREAGTGDPWVLVHDAARPCLPQADLAALIASLPGAPQGALLGMPVADTVKRAGADGRVAGTVPRAGLWRAATPQAFRLGRLQQALAAGGQPTDESGAVEALGDWPLLVACSPRNLKVTTTMDLELAELYLAAGER